MQVPPEISFRNITPTDELKNRILQEIAALEEVYERITTCRRDSPVLPIDRRTERYSPWSRVAAGASSAT